MPERDGPSISSGVTTHRLVREIHEGHAESFNPLFRRSQDRVLAYLADRMSDALRSVTTADDILQETYLRAFRGFATYTERDGVPFLAWLLAIARNQLTEAYRHHFHVRKRDPTEVVSLEALAAAGEGGDAGLPDDATGILTALTRAELVDRVLAALDELPDDYREAILGCHVRGETAAAIGGRLGRSANAVRLLLVRALRLLAEMVTDADAAARPSAKP